MATIPEALDLAINAHQQGNFPEADTIYREILKHDPRNGDALHLLGVLTHQSGNLEEASALIRQAISLNNKIPEFFNSLGNVLTDAHKLDEAITAYKRAIDMNPKVDEFWLNWGSALQEKGQLDEALQKFQQAIRLNPNLFEAYNNMGNLFKEQGKTQESIAAYQHAISINDQYYEAHFNLSTLQYQQHNLYEAIVHCQKVIALNPQFAPGYSSLGLFYHDLEQYAEAIKAYQTAISLDPKLHSVYHNLGMLFMKLQKRDEAIQSFQVAINLNSDYADAWFELGNAYYGKGFIEESLKHYEQAAQLRPGNILMQLRSKTVCPIIPESLEQIDEYRNNVKAVLDQYADQLDGFSLKDLPHHGCEPSFYLLYQGPDELPLKKQYGQIFDTLFRQKWPELMTPAKPSEMPFMQIGFLVTFRHEGVFCKLMKGFLEHLCREKFQVTIICGSTVSIEAISSQIQNPLTHYLVLPNDFEAKIRKIKEQQFDAIFHFEVGTDAYNYYLPYFHLAPVQVTSIGFPETTGIPAMNYFLSSDLIELPEADAHYTENLIRLSTMPTYFYRPQLPNPMKRRQDFNLPTDKTIYICPQSLFKFHPDFDPVLLEILDRDPNALILLLQAEPKWVETVHNRLAQYSQLQHIENAMERIQFIPRQEYSDFLSIIALSDVMLDPFHVNGGITSHEGIALGVPIVTLPSQFFRGRMTQACYRAMGVMDCVASTPEEYVEIALRLGTDPIYNQEIRQKIAAKQDVLFDNMNSVRELEAFLETAIQQQLNTSPSSDNITLKVEGTL